MANGVGRQERLGLEAPPWRAVVASRHPSQRGGAQLLDTEQKDAHVGRAGGPGIEDAVDSVRPMVGCQHRVVHLAQQELVVRRRGHRDEAIALLEVAAVDRTLIRCLRLRISSSAMSHMRVDSAPWFSLTPLGVTPS